MRVRWNFDIGVVLDRAGEMLSDWGRALRAGLPHRLRTWLEGPRSGYLLRVSRTHTELLLDGAGSSPEGNVVEAPSPVKRHRQESLDIELQSDVLLRERVELPAAPLSALRRAVSLDLDHWVPLPAEKIHFALASGQSEADRGILDLWVVERQVLDAAYQAASRVGAEVQAVFAIRADGKRVPLPEFLPATALTAKRRRSWMTAGLIGAGCLAVGITFAATLSFWDSRIDLLREETRKLRQEAQAVEKARREVGALEAKALAVAQARATPSLAFHLVEIARVLPNDTYLVQLTATTQEIRLTGLSGDASRLPGAIEASPSFGQARFVGPIVRDLDRKADRFDLAIEPKARAEAR